MGANQTTIAVGPGGYLDYRKLRTDSDDNLLIALKPIASAAIIEIALDDATWVEATAGLSDRTHLLIQNISGNEGIVQMAYASNATTGVQLKDGVTRTLLIDASIPVYVRMVTAYGTSGTVVVEELKL